MKLSFMWKTKTGEFASGESLWVGKIRLGSYSYNSSKPRGSNNDDSWVGSLELPSLKESRLYSDDSNKLKKLLETQATAWFNEAQKQEVSK